MSGKYVRSRLCRFCEFPVVDTGIRLSTVDCDKLSTWCLQMFNVDVGSEDLQQQWSCQFCLWDAKLESDCSQTSKESDLKKNETTWWIGHDDNAFYYKHFYRAKMMKPCHVSITTLPRKRKVSIASVRSKPYPTKQHEPFDIKAEPDVKPIIAAPIFCLYCDHMLINNSFAYKHIVECRPDIVEDALFDFNNYCFKHNVFEVKQEDEHGFKSCHLCITNAVYEEIDSVCLVGTYSDSAIKTEDQSNVWNFSKTSQNVNISEFV